jgi:5-methylcytosine-specific restriction protein A
MPRRTLPALKPRIPSAPPRLQPPLKTADPVYTSSEWRALIAQIIAHRGRRCEKCGRVRDELGKLVRIFGDHIRELRDGGPLLDPNNVELLCGDCHARKTAAVRAARTAMRYLR